MLQKMHLERWQMYKYIKRFLDIVISLMFIILLLPLMILLYIITKINFKGKAIFKQKRIGLNEENYDIYKFKTMKDNTKETTKTSRILRKLGLDELPQLFNVLKGDMSIIGPRPFIKDDKLPIMYEKKRHSVRPGIAGLSQIIEREELTHRKKLEYDYKYIDNMSFILDFKIFFKTLFYIIKQIFN